MTVERDAAKWDCFGDKSGPWRAEHSTNYAKGVGSFDELYPYGLQLAAFELGDPLVDVVDEAIEIMMAVKI